MPPAQIRHVNPWIVTAAVMGATFMEILDTTVVNVSVPHLAGSMGATVEEGTWVVTSYLVANAIILPMSGWLANRLGRRNVLLACVTGFTITSVLCGMATSLESLIFFRILQGLTGGGLQPLAQAVLLETFPPKQHGTAMAAFGLGIILAPILGPTLGGWITDNYSWRWIFYLNVPIGVISVIMMSAFVHDPPYIGKNKTGSIDLWGIGFLALGFGMLQVVLDTGQRKDWFGSTQIRVFTFLCVFGLVALVIRELTTEVPHRRPARPQGPHLRRRHQHHDHAGLCPLRQPHAAAHLLADPARLSRPRVWPGALPARYRIAGHDAHRRRSSPTASTPVSSSPSAWPSAVGPCSASPTSPSTPVTGTSFGRK